MIIFYQTKLSSLVTRYTLKLLLPIILTTFSSLTSGQTLVVFGDSISAAYGMDQEQGWVSLLTRRLSDQYPHYEVINASVSGETTGGGVTRLPKTLEIHQPDVLILELGGNDGLRGYPISKIKSNLSTMIAEAESIGARVLLVGMVLPPNYGQRYTQSFQTLFASLADEHNLPFVPFLLDGVTTNREMIQRDGIHPTVEAQPKLLDDVWPSLRSIL